MRAVFPAIFLLMFTFPVLAQDAPVDPAQWQGDARAMYVARTLSLRQDQVTQIAALLQQARAAQEARNKALDELWAGYEPSFTAMNQALLAGRQPTQAAATGVKRATDAYHNTRNQTSGQLERLADQMVALLDKQQATKVQSLGEIRTQEQGRQRIESVVGIPAYIERYVVAMRQLLPEEYDALRVTLALRLATRLVAPDRPGYNNAVADVLRVMDSVRRLTDAQFAQAQPQLQRSIAKALRLPDEPAVVSRPVSFDDVMFFISYERTGALLREYKADPAMEVIP